MIIDGSFTPLNLDDIASRDVRRRRGDDNSLRKVQNVRVDSSATSGSDSQAVLKLSWNSPSGAPNTNASNPSCARRFKIGASRPSADRTGCAGSPHPWRWHGSGAGTCSVAGGSPVSAYVAASVSGVAPTAERMCARGSVVLSSHVTAPTEPPATAPSIRTMCWRSATAATSPDTLIDLSTALIDRSEPLG
jgi:hypothetical protein